VRSVEVLVIGGGPAGLTAALNLAPSRRVAVIERFDSAPERIGESLAPAARRLLADMGLLAAFEAENHNRCFANRIVWGSDEAIEVDLLRDLDGPGWHLDRARFESWLRGIAKLRGACLFAPARLIRLERHASRWRASLAAAGEQFELAADVLIDASGRSGVAARILGARRRIADKLVCGWLRGSATGETDAGTTFIQAAEHGWWYSAPIPGRQRVLAFHTDADLPAAGVARSREMLLTAARDVSGLAPILAAANFADSEIGFCAAHSSELVPPAGEAWLAAGDAALAFDPLSARGLFNALFTGLAAAEAADRHLSGDRDALAGYVKVIAGIASAYRRELVHWYSQEERWMAAPFWCRRRKVSR
jgi:flavin-dependent dehydrogenase